MSPAPRGRYAALLDACKRRILIEALEANRGNVSQAALSLDLTRAGFHRLARVLAIDLGYYRIRKANERPAGHGEG
jgi:transcriptional regulator of acetoin/glycerol metabolism